MLSSGATSGATGRPTIVSAEAPLVAIASTRSPRISRRWSAPARASVPVTTPSGEITRSVLSVTTTIRRPSVLTTSGSSTSASCVLVPENSGTVTLPPTPVSPDTGTAAVGGTGVVVVVVVSITGGMGAICGVAMSIAGGGTARPTTPTPPRVRSAPSRA